MEWSTQSALDVLARRGALDLFEALKGHPLSHKALLHARGQITESVWLQRLSELTSLGVVEEVRETGDLRLSPRGRRLQGILDQIAAL